MHNTSEHHDFVQFLQILQMNAEKGVKKSPPSSQFTHRYMHTQIEYTGRWAIIQQCKVQSGPYESNYYYLECFHPQKDLKETESSKTLLILYKEGLFLLQLLSLLLLKHPSTWSAVSAYAFFQCTTPPTTNKPPDQMRIVSPSLCSHSLPQPFCKGYLSSRKYTSSTPSAV